MKILKIIGFYFKFILYFLLTLDERSMYGVGKAKGMHCYKMRKNMTSTEYWYDYTKKPTRDYITFKEFKEKHYPKS